MPYPGALSARVRAAHWREVGVEYAQPLASTISTKGSFSTAAKLSPSWKAPTEVPPSPMYVIPTVRFPFIRSARHMPATTGISVPSMEMGEQTPFDGTEKCRVQSFPPEGEVARAM